VYKSELILSGIISHHLEFSKYPLFDSLSALRILGYIFSSVDSVKFD